MSTVLHTHTLTGEGYKAFTIFHYELHTQHHFLFALTYSHNARHVFQISIGEVHRHGCQILYKNPLEQKLFVYVKQESRFMALRGERPSGLLSFRGGGAGE